MGTGVRHIVDLRDPITTAAFVETDPFRRVVVPKLERLAIASADAVLCATAEVAAEVAQRFPGVRTKHLTNGVDLSALPPEAQEAELLPGLSVAHVGSLYLGRDPAIALKAMRAFLERNPDARDHARMRFAGGADEAFLDRVLNLRHELKLETIVELMGMLERREALELLRTSRVTLVFAQGQAVNIPAKLYEAAAIGQNVIVVTEPGSPSAEAARQLKLAIIAPDDDAGLAQLFERVWRGERITSRDRAGLDAIDHRTIAKSLADFLEELTRRAGGPN
jgi:glycosyltransferase involved in cell wall biosynthesis